MTYRLAVDLPYDGEYDVGSTLALLAAHATPGAEVTDTAAGRHTRLFPGGARGAGSPRGAGAAGRSAAPPVAVTVSFADDGRIRADLEADDAAVDVDATIAAVRWWLDLDADLGRIRTRFAADPILAPLIVARPGLRVVGHPDVAEAAVSTVLGQQVSVAAGRTFAARLVAAYGSAGPAGLRRFPTPETLAAADVGDLRAAVGLTAARARTVVAVAAAFADGIEVSRHGDPADARRALLGIPGVGPWTCDYLAIRALGDRDAFPAGDLVLRRALGGVTAAQAAATAEPWAPLRAYAAVHLWTAAAYAG